MKAPAKNFIRELQSKDIKFDSKEIDGGKDWVMVRFTGKNCPTITTQFFFDADGELTGNMVNIRITHAAPWSLRGTLQV